MVNAPELTRYRLKDPALARNNREIDDNMRFCSTLVGKALRSRQA